MEKGGRDRPLGRTEQVYSGDGLHQAEPARLGGRGTGETGSERAGEASVSLLACPARLRCTELHHRGRTLAESYRDGSKNDARLRHAWPLLRIFGQARGSDEELQP